MVGRSATPKADAEVILTSGIYPTEALGEMHVRDLHKSRRIGESVLGSHLSKAKLALEVRHIAHLDDNAGENRFAVVDVCM